MGITVPSFSSIARVEAPRTTPSAGVIAAQAAGSGLLSISTGIQQSLMRRRSLESFAKILDGESPEKAQAYRSMAENTPLISFGPNTGMGAASGIGGSGSGGGGFGFEKDMLDTLDQVQRKKDAIELENQRSKNDLVEIGARSTAALQKVYAMGEVKAGTLQLEAQLKGELERLKANLGAPKSQLERDKLDAQITKTENALKIAEMSREAASERAQATIKVAEERTKATVLRSVLGGGRTGGLGKPTVGGTISTTPAFSREFEDILARKREAASETDKATRDRKLMLIKADEESLKFRADQAMRGLAPRAVSVDGAIGDNIDELLNTARGRLTTPQ